MKIIMNVDKIGSSPEVFLNYHENLTNFSSINNSSEESSRADVLRLKIQLTCECIFIRNPDQVYMGLLILLFFFLNRNLEKFKIKIYQN